MPPDRKVAWGISVEDPVNDMRRLIPMDQETIIANLGCGSPERVISLQKQLRPCTVFGCDFDPSMTEAKQIFDDDRASFPFAFFHEDITRLPNFLTQLREINKQTTGKNEGIIQAVLANNILVNLTQTPFNLYVAAFSIAYGLKPGGHVFILDHLLKDRPPYSSLSIQQEYKQRYYKAHQAGRPWGDVWTESPPRFVHHFSKTELTELFPDWLYCWINFQTRPYVGDSGKTTNSFYLILQKEKEIELEKLFTYYSTLGIKRLRQTFLRPK